MQNIKKIRENRQAQFMSTQEMLDHLFEEQKTEKKRRDDREQKEELTAFQQGEIALENAAYNDVDDDAVTTGTGRIITQNRARNNRHHTFHREKDPNGVKALAEALMSMALSTALIEQWVQRARAAFTPAASSSISSKFEDKSKEIFADAQFVYESEDVSAETARLLNNRMARILRAKKELDTITDPAEYALKKDLYVRLVERSGVREHDRIGFAYVEEKVARIERFLDPDNMDCSGMVCVARPRAATHDSRRMKVDVADQFDQDPNETVGEVKGAPVVAIPVAIPTFAIK